MKVWYNIEVQMLGECERTEELDAEIGFNLGFGESDIDEREPYRMTALFASSDMNPDRMRKYITDLLADHPDIFYIDVIYRYDSDNTPDRFVIWADGRTQEYAGKIIFEERNK